MKLSATLLLLAAFVLAGCSSGNISPSAKGDETQAAPSFSQFSDVPVPDGAHMDVGRTLLLGQGENWVGRLVYSVRWEDASALYDFYKAEMPKFGWQEITTVRASISVMTWQRGGRIATAQITDTTFGAEVILTMAPVNGNNPANAGGAAQSPPPPPSVGVPPPPAVSQQPLSN